MITDNGTLSFASVMNVASQRVNCCCVQRVFVRKSSVEPLEHDEELEIHAGVTLTQPRRPRRAVENSEDDPDYRQLKVGEGIVHC